MFSRVRATMRRFEVQFFWAAMVLGVYLAVATLLRAARHHSSAWEPWHPLFIAMVVAAVFVPIYSFLKTLDARELEGEAARRELKDELDLLCHLHAARSATPQRGRMEEGRGMPGPPGCAAKRWAPISARSSPNWRDSALPSSTGYPPAGGTG